MKQNTNIFIMIGVITLVCGQLQALTKRQFFELDQLKQQLDKRYDAGIPEEGEQDWLEQNVVIIEQMRRLDSPTAAEYQVDQDVFRETVEEQEIIKKGRARLEEIEKGVPEEEAAEVAEQERLAEGAGEEEAEEPEKKEAELIEVKIQALGKAITDELAKSPARYAEIDFKPIYGNIEGLEQEIKLVEKKLTEDVFIHLLWKKDELTNQLANAVLDNLRKLAYPIIDEVKRIAEYIRETKRTDFRKELVLAPITDVIIGRLNRANQKGLLVDEVLMLGAAQDVRENAKVTAQTIIDQVNILFDTLTERIGLLNDDSQTAKND